MNLTQLPRWLRDHYLATGLLVLISGFSQALFAATLVVNSLEDTTLADGQCTLREALENANQDTAGVGDCLAGSGDDVIDLTGLNGTIVLFAPLEITNNLILKGPGAKKLTISGNHQTIVFNIDNVIIEINGIKISEGYNDNWDWDWDCGKVSADGIKGNAGGINGGSSLTINNSIISGNLGGGITNCYGSTHIINSVVLGNSGVGIYSENDLTIAGSTVSENDDIGIVAYGITNITNSTISRNFAVGDGSGISTWNNLTIIDSIVSGNFAVGDGGGIYSNATLIIKNSTVSGNLAYDEESGRGDGGGIYSNATLIIENSTVSENFAYKEGGGIFSGETVTITSSTISGNSAYYGGGGIYSHIGTLTLTNSTVSGNSVGYVGGGIYNDGSTITITNSTISKNDVAVDNPDDPWDRGGGIVNLGTLNLKNTLIANNTNGDCYSEWVNIGTNLNNFIGDGSCNSTFSGDPKLGPLANNGGPTFTHALRRGSPAIDAGDDATCAAAPVNGLDQRGVARFGSLAGSHCDIGAYEYQKPALATLGSFTIESKAIRWETLAELGTQGFYLWQAEPVVAGTCEAVTNPQLVIPKPISAKGSEIQGEAYQAAVAVNLNGCYGIQEIPSGQIYITPRPGRNEWTGEQWLTR